MPPVCLQFVIVVFPDHTHLLLLNCLNLNGWELKFFLALKHSDVVFVLLIDAKCQHL